MSRKSAVDYKRMAVVKMGWKISFTVDEDDVRRRGNRSRWARKRRVVGEKSGRDAASERECVSDVLCG